MRVRILTRPDETLAGISPTSFQVGNIYEIRAHVACVYLARGWAELVEDVAAAPPLLTPDAPVQINAAVLVFENPAAVRRFAQQLLTYRGYRIVEARHGVEAIEQLRQTLRAVTVLDVMTPIASGCKFRVTMLYLTHTQVAAIPVMLRAPDDEWDGGARVEAMAVCRTPFDPDALLQALA